MNTQQPITHIYHLSAGRLVSVPLFCLSMFAMIPIVLFSEGPPVWDESRAFALTLVAALAAFMLLLTGIMWQSRLVLTPDGIVHHQLGYSVRSTWANVQKLDLSQGNQSLILTEPGTTSILLRVSTKLIGGTTPTIGEGVFGDLDLLGEGRVIVLAPFMAHWKRGPLRNDLLRWAPHLFDENGIAR